MAASITPTSPPKRQGSAVNTKAKSSSVNVQRKSMSIPRPTLKGKHLPRKITSTLSPQLAKPSDSLPSAKKSTAKLVTDRKQKSISSQKLSPPPKTSTKSTLPIKKVGKKKKNIASPSPSSPAAVEADVVERGTDVTVSPCSPPDSQIIPIPLDDDKNSIDENQDKLAALPEGDDLSSFPPVTPKLPVSLRKLLCFEAKLAEQADRFDEMVNFMSQVVYARRSDGKDLSTEERQLLATGFRYAVNPRRSEWRTLRAIRKKYSFEPSGDSDNICKQLENQIETELRTLCTTMIQQLTDILIPQADSIDHKVFYYKMQGDAIRYIAETAQGVLKLRASEDTRKAYAKGMEWADVGLPAVKPSRLGMALNFAVFHKEVLDDTPGAIRVAVEAFDAAMDVADDLDEKYYKDTSMLLQILWKNITEWKSEIQSDSPRFF